MWTSPQAAGNPAEVSERSCLLHCARGAGIYLPQLCGSSAPGIQGLPWRAAAGAVAASGDGRYGESLSPRSVLGAWDVSLYLDVSQPPCL